MTAAPDNQPTLRATVVIPTRNRERLLRECVEALAAQSIPLDSFEVIVCDNLSDDNTEQMIADVRAKTGLDIRHHRMDENRGPARARNTGVRMARGEVIAFTDSDCRPHADWLKNGLEPFESDPEVAMVSGAVRFKPEQPVRFFSRAAGEITDKEHPTYPTANMFYRRKVFLDMNCFNETLCYRDNFTQAVESADTDLAWSVIKSGRKTVI
ncbi:MAG: glycosyltransferase family A protein, partial [Planctomycetota bacterium]|nr:glycosyltransferase family A protein [Planctomycetota bacterium]